MPALFRIPAQPGSYHDYRLDTIYSQLLADPSVRNKNSHLIQSHAGGQRLQDLRIWSLSWQSARKLIQADVAGSPAGLEPSGVQESPAATEEWRHYRLLLDTLAALKENDPIQLPLLINNYQSACVPLQEFYLYHKACQDFAPTAASHPYLAMMAFYAAVMVGARERSMQLEPAALSFQAMLPVASVAHAMVGNILCLHQLRQGAAEAVVLNANASIIASLEPIETPIAHWPVPLQESLSVLYLNRARLFGRMQRAADALCALERSFAIKRAMCALPDGLTLLYLLYQARWSQAACTAVSILERFSQPGFCSFSWRLASHFGLPSGTRVIVTNRRLALPPGLSNQSTLSDLFAALAQDLNS
jgi:hypothetical protein